MQKVEDLAASRSEKSKPVSAFGATTRPPRRFTWPENFGKKFSRYHRRFRLRFLIATRWKPWKSDLAFTLHGNVPGAVAVAWMKT